MKRIEIFKTETGEEPFSKWLDALALSTQFKIMAYIERVAAGGSKKNIRSLGNGLFEIKIYYGSGYRVYFGNLKGSIILLLAGGDKGSQKKDISLAQKHWRFIHV